MNVKNVFLLLLAVVFACTSKSVQERGESLAPPTVALGKDESKLPHLFKDLLGKLHLSWVEENGDSTVIYVASKNEDNTWTKPILVTSGRDWFVNWADYPMVSTDNGKDWLAHFLPKSGEGTFHYNVAYITSNDDGKSWASPRILHDDGKKAEHGFVSMLPYDDNFFVCWLDGRHTDESDIHKGQMTLRAAILDKTGEKLQEWELDDKVCDCCQTGAALTPNGPVVVYRNRSDEEIRDIYITRWVEGKWTEPKAVYNDNWKIMGCPVNGPRVVSQGDQLAVAWYTSSPYSRVNVAFSEDAGDSFSKAIEINENETIGRVDIGWLTENTIVTTYMEGDTIKAALVNKTGVLKRKNLIISDAGRGSGFPQMEIWNGKVEVVYTDVEDNKVKNFSLDFSEKAKE